MVTVYTQAGKIQFPNATYDLHDGYYWIIPDSDPNEPIEAIAIFTSSTIYGVSQE